MLTVKELMEKLAQYDENELVFVVGGETANGDFGQLIVAHSMQDYYECDGCVIMESNE